MGEVVDLKDVWYIFYGIILLAGLVAAIVSRVQEKKWTKEWVRSMTDHGTRSCNQCINHNTMKCPNSSECYDTVSRPYFKHYKEK